MHFLTWPRDLLENNLVKIGSIGTGSEFCSRRAATSHPALCPTQRRVPPAALARTPANTPCTCGVWVWVCGCVGVWVCGCKCERNVQNDRIRGFPHGALAFFFHRQEINTQTTIVSHQPRLAQPSPAQAAPVVAATPRDGRIVSVARPLARPVPEIERSGAWSWMFQHQNQIILQCYIQPVYFLV